jgi:DNA-directed RNA polymerase subunit RPC12/RpoP
MTCPRCGHKMRPASTWYVCSNKCGQTPIEFIEKKRK